MVIETLKEQTRESDPKKIARAAAISKMFLEKENKPLLDFLEKLSSDKETIVRLIIENEDFNKLLKELNYKLTVVDSLNARELFDKDYFVDNKVRIMTTMLGGQSYLINFDNELKITNSLYLEFSEAYNLLK